MGLDNSGHVEQRSITCSRTSRLRESDECSLSPTGRALMMSWCVFARGRRHVPGFFLTT